MRLLLAFLLWCGCPSAALACTSSPSGELSVEPQIRSPSGFLVFRFAVVFRGPSCDGEIVGRADLSTGPWSRLAITDDGTILCLLAPRVSRPRAFVLRVFRIGDDPHAGRRRFAELPRASELHGTTRLSFRDGALVLRDAATEIALPFAELVP